MNSIDISWKKFDAKKLIELEEFGKVNLFLSVIGLPEIDIYDAMQFKPFTEECRLENFNSKNVFIFGRLFDFNICIEHITQEVFVLNEGEELEFQFVNSDFISFVQFLEIYTYIIIINLGKNENDVIMSKPVLYLETKFNSIDNRALANEVNFWSRILNELRYYYDKDI